MERYFSFILVFHYLLKSHCLSFEKFRYINSYVILLVPFILGSFSYLDALLIMDSFPIKKYVTYYYNLLI